MIDNEIIDFEKEYAKSLYKKTNPYEDFIKAVTDNCKQDGKGNIVFTNSFGKEKILLKYHRYNYFCHNCWNRLDYDGIYVKCNSCGYYKSLKFYLKEKKLFIDSTKEKIQNEKINIHNMWRSLD